MAEAPATSADEKDTRVAVDMPTVIKAWGISEGKYIV
jgi:hypothetical protein